MSEKRPSEKFCIDMNLALAEVRTYFDRLIEYEKSASDIAIRLNGEVPAKLNDVKYKLRAMLKGHLAGYGEIIADNMNAQLRICYYEGKIEDTIESKLISECPDSEWIPWRPAITELTRTVGFGLTGVFGSTSLLIALRAAGLSPVKIPLYAASPMASAAILVALAMLSGVTATNPEKIPLLMDAERRHASEHLAIFLRIVEAELLDYAEKAEKSLDKYFESLRGGLKNE